MDNKLLPQKNEGIFYKIRNFFLKLFGKKNDLADKNTYNDKTLTMPQKESEEKNPIDLMREEFKKNSEKEQLLNQIENNLNLIDNWSIEKLLKLEKIYDERILKYDNEIAILKGKRA